MKVINPQALDFIAPVNLTEKIEEEKQIEKAEHEYTQTIYDRYELTRRTWISLLNFHPQI